jgi:hypothetical protein
MKNFSEVLKRKDEEWQHQCVNHHHEACEAQREKDAKDFAYIVEDSRNLIVFNLSYCCQFR